MTHATWFCALLLASAVSYGAGAKSQVGRDWERCWQHWDGLPLIQKTRQCVPVLEKK